MATGPMMFGNAGNGPQKFGFFGGGVPCTPSEITRYFRRNLGTTDYAQFAAPITLAGSVVIEFDVLITGASIQYFFDDVDATGRCYAYYDHGAGDIKTSIAGATISVDGGGNSIGNDGVLHRVSIAGEAAGQVIAMLYDNNSQSFTLEGILANLKIWDSGTLITDCPIDEPSGATIIDKASGNNATIINGLDSDRQPYTQQENGDWLGQELWTNPLDAETEAGHTQFATLLNGNGVSINSGSTYKYSLSADVVTPRIQWVIGNSGPILSQGNNSGEIVAVGANNRLRTLDLVAEGSTSGMSLKEVLKVA